MNQLHRFATIRMALRRRFPRTTCLLLAAFFGAGLGSSGALAQARPVAQAELDALVAAAKAEGSLVWYSAPPEALAKRVSDAFSAKYGIRVQFVRLQTVPAKLQGWGLPVLQSVLQRPQFSSPEWQMPQRCETV